MVKTEGSAQQVGGIFGNVGILFQSRKSVVQRNPGSEGEPVEMPIRITNSPVRICSGTV